MSKKFKEGDWVFCEFDLHEIREIKDGRITSVSDGNFSMGSYDLSDRCFELNMRNKNISDTVKYYYRQISDLKHNSLNIPDINRELIRRWVDMCNEPDEKKLQELYKSIADFSNKITETIHNLKYAEVDGISLFRR